MRRRLLIVIALAVALLFLFPVVGTASATDHDNTSTEADADIDPGQQLSGLLSVQDAEMAGDLEQKTVEHELEQADESAADQVVTDRLAAVEAELSHLEQRKQTLDERLAAGQISRATYELELAELSVKTDAQSAIAETTVETGVGSSQERDASSGDDSGGEDGTTDESSTDGTAGPAVALDDDLETSLNKLGELDVVNITFEEVGDGIDLTVDREDVVRSDLSADLADPGEPAERDARPDDDEADGSEDTTGQDEQDAAEDDDTASEDLPDVIEIPDNFTVEDLPEKYQEILPEDIEIPDQISLSTVPDRYLDAIPDEWDGQIPGNFSFEDIPEEYRERLWQAVMESDWVEDDGVESDTDDG